MLAIPVPVPMSAVLAVPVRPFPWQDEKARPFPWQDDKARPFPWQDDKLSQRGISLAIPVPVPMSAVLAVPVPMSAVLAVPISVSNFPLVC